MKINYCLPIIKKNKTNVLQTIDEQKNNYQYFEIWLDTIEDLDDDFIKKVTDELEDRLILLFHRGNETDNRSHENKLHILDILHETNSFLDLDITEKEEITYLQKQQINVKTIISHHNYEETPKDFSEIITEMDKFNPAIYKIATMCTSEHDALRLLQLQLFFKNQQKKHIILGMGEFGTITRVYGTLWGNEMIYAPQKKEESSAPGQLTKSELEKIFELLSS